MPNISESVDLQVAQELAFNVLTDLNTTLRLSPYWSIKQLEQISGHQVMNGSMFDVTIEYYAKDLTETHRIEIAEYTPNERISLKFSQGILAQISFLIESRGDGIRLTQAFLLDSSDNNIIENTGKELSFWLTSISEYLKLSDRNTLWAGLFKWFMDKAWLRLTLSERKIAIIMLTISAAELVLLIIMVALWNLLA